MSLEQGLSQTRVAQIIQDDEGFIWFGTQHGVNRFDGNSFKVYKHDLDWPDSLSGVFIYALFKDRSGRVWVGTDQGLDAFEKTTETFRHYRLDESNPFVIHISQDGEGMLWLATGQGLYGLTRTVVRSSASALIPQMPRPCPATTSSRPAKTGGHILGRHQPGTGGVRPRDRAGDAGSRYASRCANSPSTRIVLACSGSFTGRATGSPLSTGKTTTLTQLSFTGSQIANSGLTGVFAPSRPATARSISAQWAQGS